jgi:hypothetical protein
MLYHSVRLLFCLFWFNQNTETLFRYGTETTKTNVLFRIVPKLASVRVSVVSNPGPAFQAKYRSGSRVLMTKNGKTITA